MIKINKGRTFQTSSFDINHFYGAYKLKPIAARDLSSLSFNFTWLILLLSFSVLYAPRLLAADESCHVCHAQLAQTHQSTPHGKADVECKSCHGDGAQHIVAPNANNISSFSAQQTAAALQQYGVCNDCHNNSHDTKPNAHKAAGITCGSCHSTHDQQEKSLETSTLSAAMKKLTPGSSMCYDCHQDSFAQFEFNERHRLTEGVIACTSCHDPHSPQLGMQLGGFKQSVCSGCHADVEGPFVYEHGASRVEGCAACHEPHGSPNRHMLNIQEVGSLCYSCHADAPQFHLGFSPTAPPRFDESTVCTNCHVTIHGSNLDRTLLR